MSTAFLARLAPLVRTSRMRAVCTMTTSGTEELFDLLNDDGSRSGESKARSHVHRDGDLHRSTHIWVMTTTTPPQLLLQKRAADKDTFPNRWDVSAAGHIAAGDESLESAHRELEEEIGLKGELEKMFEARACNTGYTEKHGSFIDNELQDVYVLRRNGNDVRIDEVSLQAEEVAEVRYFSWAHFRDAQRANDPHFVPRSLQYMDRFEQFISTRWP